MSENSKSQQPSSPSSSVASTSASSELYAWCLDAVRSADAATAKDLPKSWDTCTVLQRSIILAGLAKRFVDQKVVIYPAASSHNFQEVDRCFQVKISSERSAAECLKAIKWVFSQYGHEAPVVEPTGEPQQAPAAVSAVDSGAAAQTTTVEETSEEEQSEQPEEHEATLDVERLVQRLKEKDERIEELQEELEEKEQEAEALEEHLSTLIEQHEKVQLKLQSAIESRDKQIKDLQKRERDVLARLDEKTRALAAAERSLRQTQNDLAEEKQNALEASVVSDETIHALQEKIEDLQKQLKEAKSQLAQQSRKHEEQRNNSVSLHQSFDQMKQMMQSMAGNIESLLVAQQSRRQEVAAVEMTKPATTTSLTIIHLVEPFVVRPFRSISQFALEFIRKHRASFARGKAAQAEDQVILPLDSSQPNS